MQIAYVTIAGKWVKGAPLTDGSATWGQRVAGAGYAQVCALPAPPPAIASVHQPALSLCDAAMLDDAQRCITDRVRLLHQVCGSADVWGDGITPVACAHLEGERDAQGRADEPSTWCIFAADPQIRPSDAAPFDIAPRAVGVCKKSGSHMALQPM